MPKRVAVIPGDGVGPEVTRVGVRCLEVVSDLEFELFDWGCARYEKTGAFLPADGLDTLARFDAIYMGAVGWPTVPDHLRLWGLFLPIRKRFELYANVRPVKLMPGVDSPLARRSGADIDMLFVRENTEGEYSGAGGFVHQGTAYELAVETPVFTKHSVERVARYAFERAVERRKHLTSITKSNASRYAYVLWDQVVAEVARAYPQVKVERILVDAMAARMVTNPDRVDVAIGSNLFADILTDLGAAIQGGMGVAASANLNPPGDWPSMFEPVHGSAPDIAGRSLANPIGALLSAALMLRHLRFEQAADLLADAVEETTAAGIKTRDIGGTATTDEVADEVVSRLRRRSPRAQ
ncbi:MAG TPA: tartrate dehydrogenase [Candidatus Dormibacteraeota bacterium]|nr:tartrate dehydrogenase [Candidatus Dormibacteraeota bacterium]